MSYNQARLRRLNEARIATGGDYVLYWAQVYRRLERNHALDYALKCAGELGRPLVVYEGLRLDYPWASRRLHRFVLEGMAANAARAAEAGLNYWPFVETEKGQGRGLLRRLSERACLVVTDDFPVLHRAAPRPRRSPGKADGPGLRGGLELGRPAVAPRARGLRGGAPAPSHPQGLRRGLASPRRGEAPRPRRRGEAREAALRHLEGEGRRGLRRRAAPRRHRAARSPGRRGGRRPRARACASS